MTAVVETAEPAEVPGLAALTEEVRALVLAAGTTEVADADLGEIAGLVADLRTRLMSRSRARMLRSPFDGPGRARAAGEPYRLSAFNPFGVPLTIYFDADGDGATAELTADARHEGRATTSTAASRRG